MNKAYIFVTTAGLLVAGCVSESTFGETGASSGGGSSSSEGTGGSVSTGGSAAGGNATGGSSVGGGATGGGPNDLADPDLDGPYAITTVDGTSMVPATGRNVAVHCSYPTDATDGPFPVVLIGHGFNLPPSQYYGYVSRLASHGYVAMTVDFVAGFTNTDHVANANELLHGLTWASEQGDVGAIADLNNVGTTGHSLGGKVALLAASLDERVKASITVDPVDGGMSCSPAQCPDVSAMLPLGIPTGFVGETLDATGSFQACAPTAENFDTFYANADAPSLRVEVMGAGHMSFLDDLAGCGFTCNFCNTPTMDNATANALAKSFVVAFYQRHLKGVADYDAFLTGPDAQTRYVTSGLATIADK